MKAGAAGGIEAVAKAINTHTDNPDVCYMGCAALLVITYNDKSTDKQMNNKIK